MLVIVGSGLLGCPATSILREAERHGNDRNDAAEADRSW
jgi:hypothetical protein